MARYFKYFPKTLYYPKYESTSLDTVTNIVTRFKFENEFKNNSVLYYDYDIQDGDTPEIIASKFYGSPEKHWVILMLNDMIDAQWDWPLDQRTLTDYIKDKYTGNATGTQTGMDWAKENVKNYFILNTRTLNDGSQTITKYETDANTYANTTTSINSVQLTDGNIVTIEVSKQTRTYYHYELDTNEEKRQIKLLRPEFVYPLDQELKRLAAT